MTENTEQEITRLRAESAARIRLYHARANVTKAFLTTGIVGAAAAMFPAFSDMANKHYEVRIAETELENQSILSDLRAKLKRAEAGLKNTENTRTYFEDIAKKGRSKNIHERIAAAEYYFHLTPDASKASAQCASPTEDCSEKQRWGLLLANLIAQRDSRDEGLRKIALGNLSPEDAAAANAKVEIQSERMGLSGILPSAKLLVPIQSKSKKIFFDRFRVELGNGTLEQSQVDGLQAIFDYIVEDHQKNRKIRDFRYTAYALAVIFHETDQTFKTLTEFGTEQYLEKRYGPDSRIGKSIGNNSPGDGYKYRGRGYIMITGKRNYARAGKIVELDLLADPDLALRPKIAAAIAIHGLIDGVFTGRKIENFINDEKTDYVGARRVTNGLDKAHRIAGYAKKFESILIEALKEQNTLEEN